MTDYGHWTPQFPFNPSDYFGFVYKVVASDGRFYIGQKQFFNKIRRKPLKGKKRVRLDTKESNWRSYTTSGNLRDEIISKPESFQFYIIALCKDSNELNVCEIEQIVKHGRNVKCTNEFICRGASYKYLRSQC